MIPSDKDLEKGVFACMGLRSADGMIHTAQPEEGRQVPVKRRREVINSASYEEAAVCLGCGAPLCEGERSCFKAKKNAVRDKQTPGDSGEKTQRTEYLDFDLDLSDFDLDLPDFDLDLPDLDSELPDLDLDLPDFDSELDLPDFDLDYKFIADIW